MGAAQHPGRQGIRDERGIGEELARSGEEDCDRAIKMAMLEFHPDMADAGLTLIEEALRRHGTNFSDPNRHRNIQAPRGEPQTLTALREVLFPIAVARGERLLQIEHAYDRDALRRQVRAGPLNPTP